MSGRVLAGGKSEHKGDVPSASAMWTPAIAYGLSTRTSASWQLSQESDSTKHTVRLGIQRRAQKSYACRATLGTENDVRKWLMGIDCVLTFASDVLKNCGENI